MRKTVLMLLSFLAFLSFSQQTLAQESNNGIYIKLGEAKTKKSLMAFPALQYAGSPTTTSKAQATGAEIFNTVTNDLTISSYFQLINSAAFLEEASKGLTPAPGNPNGFKYESWKALNADFLIKAAFSIVGDELTLETYTYHVPRASLVFGKKYQGKVSTARRMAHTFANDLLKELTGQTGPFLSRVVVASDLNGTGKIKEIVTMDWDGNNIDQVTNHKSICLSPAWSPDGKTIAYTSYIKRIGNKFRNADMVLLNLASGKRAPVSYRKGINSGASFDPDGKHIYLTISQGERPDIYKMTYDGKLVLKVTNGPAGAMNVEPAVSPDGSKVAFSSDRSGRAPMIYVMDANGNNVKRITFAGQFNSTPAWSPDGKKIAFAGQSEDHFDIFVMNSDGSDMKRLTSARKPNGKWAFNEDPTFSPDGRFVMYTSDRTGKNQIYISTVDGTEERRVTNDEANYYKPKWSSNLE
jgi:Periplasmic component of the Tol biopolymer transport system